eukprot:tig00020878_g14873.t1
MAVVPEEVAAALQGQPVPPEVHDGDEYGDSFVWVEFNADAVSARRNTAGFPHVIPPDPKQALASAFAQNGGRPFLYPDGTTSTAAFRFNTEQDAENALARIYEDQTLSWARKAAGVPDVARVIEFSAVRNGEPKAITKFVPFNLLPA